MKDEIPENLKLGLNSHLDIGVCGECLFKIHPEWWKHWIDSDMSRELRIRDMHFNTFIQPNSEVLEDMKNWRHPDTGQLFHIGCDLCRKWLSDALKGWEDK